LPLPGKFAFCACAVLGALALSAPAASAGVEELLVREVYAGGAHNDSYVVLQASAPEQNLVTGHTLTAYNASGSVIGAGTFQSDFANDESQMTLLIADTSYVTSFNTGPAPNLSMPGLNLSPAGGAVCWEAFDCVAWGSFSGATPSPTGENANAMTTSQRYVLNRDIDGGCPSALDADDDTDDSLADFSQQLPVPRNNGSHIPEIICEAPASAIDTRPPAETDSTSAEFSFHSIPDGADLECRLRGELFTPCESGSRSYTSLPEGYHQFQVRAREGSSPAGAPASFRWEIDLTAPITKIDDAPEDPTPGPYITFDFSADDDATFEFSLEPAGQPDDYRSCVTQETYFAVPNGAHVFRVRATDTVGHLGPPASYEFSVDSTLVDRIPPETTITSTPPQTLPVGTASFTYESSEPRSSFQCKLDDGAFEFCLDGGITYDHLSAGPHTFQVRARDEKANVDPTPAAYGFVVSPLGFEEPLGRRHPNTHLNRRPRARSRNRRPTVRFSSAPAGAWFQCRIDGRAWKRCRSPLRMKKVAYGAHTFSVRAVLDGLVDRSPVRCAFTVVRKKRGARRR
jgi:hypothetical protein